MHACLSSLHRSLAIPRGSFLSLFHVVVSYDAWGRRKDRVVMEMSLSLSPPPLLPLPARLLRCLLLATPSACSPLRHRRPTQPHLPRLPFLSPPLLSPLLHAPLPRRRLPPPLSLRPPPLPPRLLPAPSPMRPSLPPARRPFLLSPPAHSPPPPRLPSVLPAPLLPVLRPPSPLPFLGQTPLQLLRPALLSSSSPPMPVSRLALPRLTLSL